MKTALLKSIILFISIFVVNSITFALGTLMHEMHQSTITAEQFQGYQTATIRILIVLIIAIPLFEALYATRRISNKTAIGLYFGIFTLIAVLSFDQFLFRPYEHGLTFISIVSILLTRELLNRRVLVRKTE